MTKFWIHQPDGEKIVFEADAVGDNGNGLINTVTKITNDSVDIILNFTEKLDCIQEAIISGKKVLMLRTTDYRDEAQKVVWDKEVERHNNPDGGNVLAPSP